MNYAIVNGVKLAYRKYGTGFPVIFIHGYGAKKEIWKPQITDISKKFEVITFDLRGTGESDRPNIPYTMKMLAKDVSDLVDFLKLKKTHIVGRSLGGMIAQHYALLYPKKLEKLVLIATNYGRKDAEWVEVVKNNRLKELQTLKHDPLKTFKEKSKWVFHVKFRKEMEANPKKKFYNSFSMEDLINESTINPSRPQDVINQAEAMKTHYSLEKLGCIKSETLIVAASHDRLTPVSVMKEINNKIPNCTLKIIDNAGHFFTLSRAPEVNEIILDFLED